LQSNDWPQVQAVAHKMIPSFLIMGIDTEYENLARKVQEYARTREHIDLIPDLVHQLIKVLAQVCEELREESEGMIKNEN
jgi:hypothetical protein